MNHEIKKREIEPLNDSILNDSLYDSNLSIEELEERLELAAPWICIGYACGDCGGFSCNPVA